MKKKINIAIVGLGNIGSYFYNYVKKNKNILTKKTNVEANIRYVSAKNKSKRRNVKIPKKIWLKNYIEATKKKDIDIIVELIGGAEGPAKKLVFSALKNKKHVITANKALIAKYGNQLAQLAEKNNVNLEYEAAVCGGIPIIRTLKEGLIANSISKIYGIFNGTSNYILSSMDKNKLQFKEALDKAKSLGYAESNASSDLNGDDVASKLKILSSLSFNSFINNSEISIEGIKEIDQIDIHNANSLGYKIKLLGIAEHKNGKIIQRVHPCLVNINSYIGKINDVLNAVIVDSNPLGRTVLQGPGAGAGPTCSALVSDLSSILRGNIKFPFVLSFKERKMLKFESITNKLFSVYLRLDVTDKPGVLSDITKIMSKNKVSIKRLIQNPFKSKKYSSIIIVTHKAKNISISKTIKLLNKKNYLIKKTKIIRIEEH
tara:strand:- start:831 stop:2123 length:1293 start_codon:yes stop_codon:yes gene_type:complete